MSTKIKCLLTITEWGIVMHGLQEEDRRIRALRHHKNPMNTDAGVIYLDLVKQLNDPEIIKEEADKFPEGCDNTEKVTPPPEPYPAPPLGPIDEEPVFEKPPTVSRDTEGDVVPPKITLPE